MEPSIQVQNLSKIYRLYGRPWNRIREKFPWNRRRQFHREVAALRNLDFTVAPGQCLGVVGANGAGKSTLLKILTGTTVPSSGSYTLRGQIASLLELGAGFHPEFTGTENILMNAAMLGIPRREAKKRVGSIAEFSELGEFLEAPLRTYSSGMVCRLGFSVAVATDPEILILDEILSVGDMAFQKKCIEKIWDYKTRGKTLLFCSHSLYHLRQICDEAIWLRKGELVMHGDSVAVTNEYATYETKGRGSSEHMPWDGEEEGAGAAVSEEPATVEPGEDHPHIVEALLMDPRTGQGQNTFKPGDPVMVKVRIKNSRVPQKLALAIGFLRTDGTLCFAPTTEMDGVPIDFAEGTVTLLLKGVRLLSGEFSVPVWLLDRKGLHRYHEKPTTENLVIQNRDRELGLFVQDREWRVEPSGATLQGRVAPEK